VDELDYHNLTNHDLNHI